MTPQDYSFPVAHLLTIGLPEGNYKAESWPDYLATYGLTAEHLPDLIRMANDYATFWGDDSEYFDDDPELYAIPHAIHAIGQLKTRAGVDALLALLQRNDAEGWDSDWIHEDIPSAIALAGELALEPIAAFLADRSKHNRAKTFLVSALGDIAKAEPTLRERVLLIYRSQLASYARQSRWYNATIVSALVDLQDVDSAELIKEAYEAQTVDLSICGDWEEVHIELGLLEKRVSPPPPGGIHWMQAEAEAVAALEAQAAERRKAAQFRRAANAKKKQKAKRKRKRKR